MKNIFAIDHTRSGKDWKSLKIEDKNILYSENRNEFLKSLKFSKDLKGTVLFIIHYDMVTNKLNDSGDTKTEAFIINSIKESLKKGYSKTPFFMFAGTAPLKKRSDDPYIHYSKVSLGNNISLSHLSTKLNDLYGSLQISHEEDIPTCWKSWSFDFKFKDENYYIGLINSFIDHLVKCDEANKRGIREYILIGSSFLKDRIKSYDCLKITSEEELKSHKSDLKDKDVIIIPELIWGRYGSEMEYQSKRKELAGCDIAYRLYKMYSAKDKPRSINFLTDLPLEIFTGMSSLAKNLAVVSKNGYYYTFDDVKNKIKKDDDIALNECSVHRWIDISENYLSFTGLVDFYKHQISGLIIKYNNRGEDGKEDLITEYNISRLRFSGTLNMYYEQKEPGIKEIIYPEISSEMNFSDIIKELHGFEDYLNELKMSSDKNYYFNKEQRVIILEDEEQFGKDLKGKLEHYFEKVVHFQDPEDFRKNIESDDIAFIDLMSLDSEGYWQKEMGYDILSHVNKTYPAVVCCVLTSYPKQYLNKLGLTADHVLFKDPVSILPRYLNMAEFCREISLKAVENRKIQSIIPDRGAFTDKEVQNNFEDLCLHNKNFWDEIKKHAKEYYENLDNKVTPRNFHKPEERKKLFVTPDKKEIFKNFILLFRYRAELLIDIKTDKDRKLTNSEFQKSGFSRIKKSGSEEYEVDMSKICFMEKGIVEL